jgi:hypothetical protein
MAEVEIKRSGNVEFVAVFLNGRRLRFKDDVATPRVATAEDHALQWMVRGGPGATFGLHVARPERAKWKYEVKLDVHGRDAGLHWLRID